MSRSSSKNDAAEHPHESYQQPPACDQNGAASARVSDEKTGASDYRRENHHHETESLVQTWCQVIYNVLLKIQE